MTDEPKPLDVTDRRILDVLQREGRLSNLDLSKRVHLSATPCLARVKRLERDGVIAGYRAMVDPGALDAELQVFVQVLLDRTTPDVFDEFARAVQRIPEVLECHMVSGGFDYLIKARVKDMAAYRNFLGKSLVDLPSVRETHSYVVMEAVKDTTVIPVPGIP